MNMRITNTMLGEQFLRSSNRALAQVQKYNLQVASGKKLTSIADDPAATTAVLRARTKLYTLKDYQSNIATASSYLKEVEGAVSDLDEIVKTVYEKVIHAINGVMTEEDRRAIAAEIRALQDEVFAIGNQSIGTSYLFGGYNFTGQIDGTLKTAPFSLSETENLIYNGINLSIHSWSDEFNEYVNLMRSYAAEIGEVAKKLNSDPIGEGYAKEQCGAAHKILQSLIAAGENALFAARRCDIDPNASTAYQALLNFVSNIKELSGEFYSEMSKENRGAYVLDPATVPDGVTLPEDIPVADELKDDGSVDKAYYEERGISVYAYDEFLNKFDPGRARDLMASITNALEEALTAGGPKCVIEPLEEVIAIKLNTVGLGLPEESFDGSKKEAYLNTLKELLGQEPKLPVGMGLNQTADYTINGLALFGTGRDNLYHILDKIACVLDGELDEGELKDAVSRLQDAQSRTLTLLTSIGANQNRLTLLSNRYDSSQSNYSLMRSNAEDVDIAEASINLATAQTVYNAALAGGAQMLRTSLIDYLR